jgi:hypothetical protein
MRGANRGWGGCWAEDAGRGLAWVWRGTITAGAGSGASPARPGDGRRLTGHLLVEDVLGLRLGQGGPSRVRHRRAALPTRGGPGDGAMRGNSASSPIWLRICCTGAASVMRATMRTVSAMGGIAAVLVRGVSVRCGSLTAPSRTLGAELPVDGRWPGQERSPSMVLVTTAKRL